VCVCVCVYYMHTYMHTYMHAYIHAYINTWALLPPRERASAGCAARFAHTNAVGARLGAEVCMTFNSIRAVFTVNLL